MNRCDLFTNLDLTYTDSNKFNHYELPKACDETMKGTKGDGYRGCQTKTTTGRTCQNWNKQSPQSHSISLTYAKGTMGDHNYCRNPDGMTTIWCYTTDPSKRWEYCTPLNDCPAPLTSMQLIKEKWACGDNGANKSGENTSGVTLNECQSIC